MTTKYRYTYDPVCVTAHKSSCDVQKDIRLTRDTTGNCIYKEVGEFSVSEYINSFKNGCSLKAMLERCNLMPVRDKIAYLNNNSDGVSADLSDMPTDLTAAIISLNNFKAENPEIVKRLNSGESIDSIINSFAKSIDNKEEPSNGENESGNE